MLTNFENVELFVMEDGRPSLRAAEFMREAVRVINLNTPIQGSGSPEGVITADPTQRYMDTAGASGSVLYIKQSGTGNTGWVLA